MCSSITDISRFVAFLKSFGIEYVEETVAGSIFVRIISPFKDSIPYYYFFNSDGEYTGIHYSHTEEKTATFFLRKEDSDGHNLYHCDTCHKEFDASNSQQFNFCPCCGVRFSGIREAREHGEPRWQYDLRKNGFDLHFDFRAERDGYEYTYYLQEIDRGQKEEFITSTWSQRSYDPIMHPDSRHYLIDVLSRNKQANCADVKYRFVLEKRDHINYKMIVKLAKRPVT